MRSLINFHSILLGLFFPTLASAVTLASSAFVNNGVIPNEFTYALGSQCSGSNLSPPLTIGAIPVGTQSLALTVIDPDGGNWVHWKAWGIPASTTSLSENISLTASFNQGVNDFGTTGYGGPCPPSANHHYVFTLYALNTTFSTEPSISQLEGTALATATLTGVRSPSDNVSAPPITSTNILTTTEPDCLFNWGEDNSPSLLSPSRPTSQSSSPYYFRHYTVSNTYLGYSAADDHLYFLGPDGTMADLGLAATWSTQAGCR